MRRTTGGPDSLRSMELLEWNARRYDSLPLPHLRGGEGVIGQLELAGGETVADIGCGTGRDAERLLGLLPRGRVAVVDGSEQMLAQMRTRLAGRLDRVDVVRADLRRPLALPRQVDAAISVATLHWLPDHTVVFESVARALRPGGRFVAEAGGLGNIASVLATVVRGAVLRDMPEPERAPFVHTVAQRLEEPVIDYVRLQLSATRP